MAQQPYQYAGYSSDDTLHEAVEMAVAQDTEIDSQSQLVVKALRNQLQREGFDV